VNWEIIAIIVAVVLAFFICREVVCWYWKINEGIQLLREINLKLSVAPNRTQLSVTPPDSPHVKESHADREATAEFSKCKNCGWGIPSTETLCPRCKQSPAT
jgi:hypothetical protein